MFQCSECNYFTDRKFNLQRHFNVKHSDRTIINHSQNIEEKVNPNQEKVNPNQEKVNPNQEKVNSNELYCKKCNKKYKTLRHLKTHEIKCNYVDSLTCPRCMISFTNRKHKSRHIKADKCIAISIPDIKEKNKNIKRKKHISSTIKRLVWNTHIGEEIGKCKCLCCKTTSITQLSFNCGHIVAEANGGDNVVSNLKPICQNCNSSMGTKNMDIFIKSLQ